MSKEQKEFEKQKCVCGHYRSIHNGISGTCYYPNCDCIKFVQEIKK